MLKLFTVGHSVHTIDYFLKLLNQHNVNCVVDVRSNPYSRFAPQYNMNNLKKTLNDHDKYYVFMGEEFGARRSDLSLYHTDGYLDFEKVISSSLFKLGITRLKDGLSNGYSIALMCTEKDPIDCHRSILVARGLEIENFNVSNIHADGHIETQNQLRDRMLSHYFPNRNQVDIFELIAGEQSKEAVAQEAYRLRNKDIAYRIENEAGVI